MFWRPLLNLKKDEGALVAEPQKDSPAVKAGGFIYVSGTLAQDDSGSLIADGDAAGQTRQIIERMPATMELAAAAMLEVDEGLIPSAWVAGSVGGT